MDTYNLLGTELNEAEIKALAAIYKHQPEITLGEAQLALYGANVAEVKSVVRINYKSECFNRDTLNRAISALCIL